MSNKLVIAVDVDEVLAQFIPTLTKWYNNTYSKNFELDDYKTYNFCDTWKVSDSVAMEICFDFFKTDEFKMLPVIESAHNVLKHLKRIGYTLVVCTSRQLMIEEITRSWVQHFFPDLFDDLKFGNIWLPDKNAKKHTKFEMCRDMGAICLIDDQPKYIRDVDSVCSLGVLFNWKNSYGWSDLQNLDPQYRQGCLPVTDWDVVGTVLDLLYQDFAQGSSPQVIRNKARQIVMLKADSSVPQSALQFFNAAHEDDDDDVHKQDDDNIKVNDDINVNVSKLEEGKPQKQSQQNLSQQSTIIISPLSSN